MNVILLMCVTIAARIPVNTLTLFYSIWAAYPNTITPYRWWYSYISSISLKSGPWSQNRLTHFWWEKKTSICIRSRCTDVVPVVRKRNDTNELWYTIPYHFQPNYTRNKSMVCTGTPEKKKRKNKNTRKEKKERKRSKQALRAQAESVGGKVAVCWYDQSCDVSIWWTKIRTTNKQKKEKKEKKAKKAKRDQTEDKTRRGYTETTTKRAVLCPAAGPRTTHGTQKEDRETQAREQGGDATNLAGNRATQQTKQNKTLGIVTQ